MTEDALAAMVQARARFMELVAEVRPELHRYCARMAGDVFDGEDIVQDTLAKAYFALSEMGQPPPLRPWLFRIAHNTAMDFLRRYERTHVERVAQVPEMISDVDSGPDAALVEAALSVFAALPAVQRSALVLKDVLGHSLEETAATLGTTVPAVKAALVRARANVAKTPPVPVEVTQDLQSLQHYAQLFNARDWDGLRALLAEEVRIDLVARWQRQGKAVGPYYARYAEVTATEDLQARARFVAGQPVLAVSRSGSTYFMQLTFEAGRLTQIRDYFYVPYLAADARFVPVG